MSITNVSKPSSSYTNTAKPTTGLIWNDATMTWNAQTDTWDGTGSLIDNTVRIGESYLMTEGQNNLATEGSNNIIISGSEMTNIARP